MGAVCCGGRQWAMRIARGGGGRGPVPTLRHNRTRITRNTSPLPPPGA